jgi:DNA-binding NarL/FixJ family response regulator
MTADCGGPILIVDDDAAARTLAATILHEAGFETCEAADGARALTLARARDVSAVLLDVALPRLSGYEVCRALRIERGETLPILFASGERVDTLDQAAGLLIGGDDYLVKPYEPAVLVARVRRHLARARALTAGGLRPSQLTDREREVLELLADGLNSGEIAERLVISEKTVSTHIQRILVKLGVHSRAEAVAAAYREGLVDTIVR